MPSFVFPKRATEYIFYVSLVSQADTKLFQVNPTIAAGDFKVSIDGGALNNPATLPAVTPAGGRLVKVVLSIAEMTGDNIMLVGSDAAGAEWCDITVNIQTTLKQADDLATPANVNAEVLDVLNVDTFAEPTGVPAATTTLAGKLGRIYQALRNRVSVTATKKTLYDDANVALWEKDLTDDGVTYDESESNAP